jgi:hypothetical protein
MVYCPPRQHRHRTDIFGNRLACGWASPSIRRADATGHRICRHVRHPHRILHEWGRLRLPRELAIGVWRSHFAIRRGDLAGAGEAWASLRRVARYSVSVLITSKNTHGLFNMSPRNEADRIMPRAMVRFREAAWPAPRHVEAADHAGDGNTAVAPRQCFARDCPVGKRAVHSVEPPGTRPPAWPGVPRHGGLTGRDQFFILIWE